MSILDKLATFKSVIAMADKIIEFLVKVVDYILALLNEQKV